MTTKRTRSTSSRKSTAGVSTQVRQWATGVVARPIGALAALLPRQARQVRRDVDEQVARIRKEMQEVQHEFATKFEAGAANYAQKVSTWLRLPRAKDTAALKKRIAMLERRLAELETQHQRRRPDR